VFLLVREEECEAVKKWLGNVLFFIYLFGCSLSKSSSYEYIFTGEGDDWKAEYKEAGTGEATPYNDVEDELIGNV
jgi:hypothetical protein